MFVCTIFLSKNSSEILFNLAQFDPMHMNLNPRGINYENSKRPDNNNNCSSITSEKIEILKDSPDSMKDFTEMHIAL